MEPQPTHINGIPVSDRIPNDQQYLRDPRLPKAKLDVDWTPEMLGEISNCTDNIRFFAENYFFITTLDEGKKKIGLYPAQIKVLKLLENERFVILCTSRQAGKALDLNTPINTPNGWSTMGDIKDGDQVYDENGNPCNVLKAHDVLYNRKCYKMTFSTGEEIIADEDHNWFTQTLYEKKKNILGTVKTTKEILNTLYFNGGNAVQPMHKIPKAMPICGSKDILPIDPYVLGLWLGDGSRHAAGHITVGKKDIIEISEILNSKNINHTIKELEGGLNAFNQDVYYSLYIPNLQALLNKLNLFGHKDKHIPLCYMTADIDSRKELLKGLMDSDGTLTEKLCDFCNTEYTLIKGVEELLWGLGVHKISIRKKKNYCKGKQVKDIYNILFKVDFPAFNLKRKLNKQTINLSIRTQYVYIKKIEPVESRPVRCLTVDSPNHLFLCGKTNIVTHNTTLMTIYALWMACFQRDKRIIIVANKERTAKMILRRVQTAYKQLPNWIKPGIEQWGSTEIVFDNDSSIAISTTSGSAVRGESLNCVTGDSVVTIKDKESNETFDINMKDLADMISKNGKIINGKIFDE